MAKPLKLVVLISGSGSNLQAIIDAIESGTLSATIECVISNVPGVKGLQRAEHHHLHSECIPHQNFDSRDAFDFELQKVIDSYSPDLVILAGFMRILGQDISRHYRGRMLNIHPSLLPKYPGLHTHKRALEAGDKEHGTTIHYVTEELDGGPVVYQRRFMIEDDDTEQTLFQKVQALEHQMYPQVISWIQQGRLSFTSNKPLFDNQHIGSCGV
jgi:phosphoribosylglycinamide formyltransferase-1